MASEKDKDGLTSMKRTRRTPTAVMPMGDDEGYEYGLCIRLENESLDKLKLAMPQVGKEFKITAIGKVTHTATSNSSEDDDADRCVTIQITDMAIR